MGPLPDPTSEPPEGAIHGYYRVTNILYAWKDKIEDKDEQSAMSALLAHDSLVRDDHPFHEDGVNGVKLFIGQCKDGRQRLLFSSGQIEYLRYWLYAVGLSLEMIPGPYSDCMLVLGEDILSVSPIIVPTGRDLKQLIKDSSKKSWQNIPKIADIVQTRRDTFERVRLLISQKTGVFIAMDFECWDLDHTVIKEFGWSSLSWDHKGKPIEKQGHIILDQHQVYRNKYTENYGMRYFLGHERSQSYPSTQIKSAIRGVVYDLCNKENSEHVDRPHFFIFHDKSGDLKYLEMCKISTEDYQHTLPEIPPTEGTFVIDTNDLIRALQGSETQNKMKLEHTCALLGIETRFLHNAGNDAHYTMLAFRAMGEGDPITVQRKKRWPDYDGTKTIPFERQIAKAQNGSDSDEALDNDDDDAQMEGLVYDKKGRLVVQDGDE